MRRILTLAVGFGAFAAAAPAQADMYYSRGEAQRIAKEFVAEKYEFAKRDLGTYCRPQGRARPEPGYEYHSWACSWVSIDACDGQVVIRGSRRGRDWYRAFVSRGINC